MDPRQTSDSGAKRRAAVRMLMGRPGSLRRWIVGSVVWLGVCAWVYAVTGNLLVLILAVLLDVAAFVGRSVLVGDEDEFHAELTRTIVHALRRHADPVEDTSDESDPSEWFTRGGNRLKEAPSPPILDGEEDTGD